MGYLWTGQEWVWNPCHGSEGGPSRYAAHKKSIAASATSEEMDTYRQEQMRPADRAVRRLFAELGRARRMKRRRAEQAAWSELVQYLSAQGELTDPR
jgi:hypothetical protein